jgi:hypothetical protein
LNLFFFSKFGEFGPFSHEKSSQNYIFEVEFLQKLANKKKHWCGVLNYKLVAVPAKQKCWNFSSRLCR